MKYFVSFSWFMEIFSLVCVLGCLLCLCVYVPVSIDGHARKAHISIRSQIKCHTQFHHFNVFMTLASRIKSFRLTERTERHGVSCLRSTVVNSSRSDAHERINLNHFNILFQLPQFICFSFLSRLPFSSPFFDTFCCCCTSGACLSEKSGTG